MVGVERTRAQAVVRPPLAQPSGPYRLWLSKLITRKKTAMKQKLTVTLLGLVIGHAALGHVAHRPSKRMDSPDLRLLIDNWDFTPTGKGARVRWADRSTRRVTLSLAAG